MERLGRPVSSIRYFLLFELATTHMHLPNAVEVIVSLSAKLLLSFEMHLVVRCSRRDSYWNHPGVLFFLLWCHVRVTAWSETRN
jgi:hypothetical protein